MPPAGATAVGNIFGNANGSDIVSMSFGVNVAPPTSPTTNQLFNNDMGAGFIADVQATEARMADASANGRGGLGTIYVKSAGNNRGTREHRDARRDPPPTTMDHVQVHDRGRGDPMGRMGRQHLVRRAQAC